MIMNKEHLTVSGLQRIQNIKNKMNSQMSKQHSGIEDAVEEE
jgi:hypothetical protein